MSELLTSSRSNGNSDEFLIRTVWDGPISDSDVEDDVVSQQPIENADDPDKTLAENVYEESFSSCIGDGEDNFEVKSPKVLSERKRKTPAWHKDYNMNYTGFAFNASSYVDHVPTSLTEAKSSADWEKWKAAILEEMDSLTRNHTWTLEKLPHGRIPITCKWVFKVKRGESKKWRSIQSSISSAWFQPETWFRLR